MKCTSDVDHLVLSHNEFVRLFQQGAEGVGLEGVHVEVLVPHFFDVFQKKTIRDAGAIMGIVVCKFYNQLKPRGPSTMCGASLSAKRMTRFEPAGQPRGSQGSCSVEAESRLPRGSCGTMPETAS